MYDFINEDVWIEMLKSRNDMTHIYDGEAEKRLVNIILQKYIPEFLRMQKGILERYGDILEQL